MDLCLDTDAELVEAILASEAAWLGAGLGVGLDAIRVIIREALDIERDVVAWLGDRPFDRRRVLPTCLLVAAAAPGTSREARLVTAAVGLWTAMIDDCFDDGHWPRHALLDEMAACHAASHGLPDSEAVDDLSTWALASVRDILEKSPLCGPLVDRWVEANDATMVGMLHEFDWRAAHSSDGAAALPSFEVYVANGGDSIGMASVCWAALIAQGNPAAVIEQEALAEVIRLSGMAFRLANDLRSDTKEREEGTINALTLFEDFHQQAGATPEAARRLAIQSVRGAIEDLLEQLAVAELALQDDGPTMRFPGACTRLLVKFYGQRDFLPCPSWTTSVVAH